MNNIDKLVTKAKDGVQSAFNKLYKLTEKDVWFTCITLIKHEENAKDVFQNTYITAFSKINTLEDNNAFPSWIKRIAVNKCKDFFKGKVEYQIEDDYMKDFVETDELKIPEEYINKNEKRKIILQLMEENLSYVQYQTVFMHYFNNMSVADIAQDMECSEGTVKSRLNSSRTKMKTAITEYESQNNDRLHSVVLIPLFSSVFENESKATNVPKFNFKISTQGGKATVSIVSNGTKPIRNATVKGLFATAKAKVITTVCISAVVVGTIGAVAVLTNTDKKPSNAINDYTAPTLSTPDQAIINAGLKVDDKGEIVTTDGEKVEVSEDGKVEVTTEDGVTVEVDVSEITEANKKHEEILTKPTEPTTQKPTESKKTWHEAVYKEVYHPAVTKEVKHPAETKTVKHDAVTEKKWVETKAAYTYEKEVTKDVYGQWCNDCNANLTGWSADAKESHCGDHLWSGGKGSWRTGYNTVTTTETVEVPAEGYYKTVVVKEAWTETVVVKEAWTETVVVKEAWTEKVLVKEAGWY